MLRSSVTELTEVQNKANYTNASASLTLPTHPAFPFLFAQSVSRLGSQVKEYYPGS
jgi:hypothetical protein